MNMRIINLIVFFLLTNIINSNANKDSARVRLDTLQNRSVNTSDFIFLGKLNSIDTINKTLYFKIIEEFKGAIKSDIINIKVKEVTYIDKGLWIVYMNRNADSTYKLNMNGLSRSIIRPERIPVYNFPPPPPLKYETYGLFTYTDKYIDFRITALKDWYVELESLRYYKKNNSKDVKIERFDFKPYFYSSLFCILFCLSLIFYLLFQLRKTNR